MSEPSGSNGGQPSSGQQGAVTPGQGPAPAAPQYVTTEQLNGALHARLQRTEERLLELIESKFKATAGTPPATPATPASGSASGKNDGDSELRAQLDEARKQAAQEREQRIRHEKVVTLRGALQTAACADVDSALDILAQRQDLKVRTAPDGTMEWVGKVEDGYGGTREAPVSEVVSEFLRKRPLFAPARGAGSGARGAIGAPGGRAGPSWEGKALHELTPDELVSMPAAERAKVRQAASGVQIGVFGGGGRK